MIVSVTRARDPHGHEHVTRLRAWSIAAFAFAIGRDETLRISAILPCRLLRRR